MNTKKLSFALALVASAGLANAQTFSGSGFAINDVSANSSTISVSGGPVSIPGIEVTIFALTHTWFSDLTCYLTAPNGDVINLFVRPPTGNNPNGTYIFSDSASAPVSAADLSGGTFLPVGGTFAGTFGGDDSNGIWRLNIDDLAAADVGSIQGWQLNIIPAPGAAAVMGLGGLIIGRRRRA